MNSNSNSVESMISNIVNVVFRIHFYYVNNKDLEQDLKQEGYLKAYELLYSCNYDPTRNLRTFIYTGVRNAMTNYMYHSNKENHLDLESITSSSWQKYESVTLDDYWRGKVFYVDDYYNNKIDDSLITDICNKYKCFGRLEDNVKNRLSLLGLYNAMQSYNIIEDEFNISDIIVGEILWNLFS